MRWGKNYLVTKLKVKARVQSPVVNNNEAILKVPNHLFSPKSVTVDFTIGHIKSIPSVLTILTKIVLKSNITNT